MSARFEVFQSTSDHQWYWRLIAGNGEIVAQSEGYTRSEDAERGVQDARRAANDAEQM